MFFDADPQDMAVLKGALGDRLVGSARPTPVKPVGSYVPVSSGKRDDVIQTEGRTRFCTNCGKKNPLRCPFLSGMWQRDPLKADADNSPEENAMNADNVPIDHIYGDEISILLPQYQKRLFKKSKEHVTIHKSRSRIGYTCSGCDNSLSFSSILDGWNCTFMGSNRGN